MPTAFAYGQGVNQAMRTTPVTRRERMRIATVAEIKATARRLLAAGGPAAISLRAIAREMGMTAAAIYRYFPGLDALLRDLCTDLYNELSVVLEAVGETEQPAARLAEMARTFRRWSVSHPAEFALMFGNPVAGAGALETGSALYAAGARFGAAFLGPFTELWRRNPVPLPAARQLAAELQPHFTMYGDDLPVEAVYLFTSAWTRLYGMVALEVFGHFQWALTDVERFFETELALFLQQLEN
jgi:AcrR family transcriptional regulator